MVYSQTKLTYFSEPDVCAAKTDFIANVLTVRMLPEDVAAEAFFGTSFPSVDVANQTSGTSDPPQTSEVPTS